MNDELKKIILKPGREKSVLHRHPWVFSGAIDKLPQVEAGELVSLYSQDQKFLGVATCNPASQITCRMLSYTDEPIEQVIREKIMEAYQLRKELFSEKDTTGYRLINAEGDGLSGLIVDKYDTALVVQISSAGMEKLKPIILECLLSICKPSWIYEKSTSPSRKEEAMAPLSQTLYGTAQEEVLIREEGLGFKVDIQRGQKTGFFLDQRSMRKLIKSFAKGRRVLNTFSYTGAFSLAALSGGAELVDSVDISKEALNKVSEHIALNDFSKIQHHEFEADAIQFLASQKLDYDLVILDPPAFAKRKSDIKKAARAYKELNRQAFLKMPKNSFLLTCSCSYHIDEDLFQKIVFSAALDAGRNVRILTRHHSAYDHPMNIYHPEGTYLKSLFCYIT